MIIMETITIKTLHQKK